MTSHPFWFPFDVNEDELLRLLQYQSRIPYKYGATCNPQRQFGYIFYNPFTRCLKCISDSQSKRKDLKNTFRLLRQFLEESTFIFNFFHPYQDATKMSSSLNTYSPHYSKGTTANGQFGLLNWYLKKQSQQ